jgi:PIN domain nuclease of toxin-antitoxin system
MIVAIADTHAAIWYLFSDNRLGVAASAFIDNVIKSGDHIGVSSISVAEVVYLIEKGRIPVNALKDLHTATADPKAVLQHGPLDQNIAMKMAEIPRQDPSILSDSPDSPQIISNGDDPPAHKFPL